MGLSQSHLFHLKCSFLSCGKGQSGPSDLPLSAHYLKTLGFLQGVAPHPPHAGLPRTVSIPERAHPLFPAQVRTWQGWVAARTAERPIPASEVARGECWTAASHNRPQGTEGHLSGDPEQPHVNLRSCFGCSSSSCLAVKGDGHTVRISLWGWKLLEERVEREADHHLCRVTLRVTVRVEERHSGRQKML